MRTNIAQFTNSDISYRNIWNNQLVENIFCSTSNILADLIHRSFTVSPHASVQHTCQSDAVLPDSGVYRYFSQIYRKFIPKSGGIYPLWPIVAEK
jgi:hypothetical protein